MTYEVLEDALELDDKDWVEELAKKHFENKEKAYANATPETPADYQPKLPNINYTGIA